MKKSTLRFAVYTLLFFHVTLVSCQESISSEVKIVDKSTVLAMLEEVKEGQVQLLDVRTAAEFSRGAIPGAINLDIRGADFKEQLEDFDTDKPIVIYCHSGVRSSKASELLKTMGFTKIYDYKGGYSDWSQN